MNVARYAVGSEDVARAATLLRSRDIRRTCLFELDYDGLFVKCEHEQLTGSFKIRGAVNALEGLRPSAVVTGSSGNHGRALAFACRAVGVPLTVVMTSDSEERKRAAIVDLGATVISCPPGTAERDRAVAAFAELTGACIIPSYDHPLVIAGQGTVGLEILEQLPRAATVVAPVGGGGLLAGISVAIKSLRPDMRVVGAEPTTADDMRRSVEAGWRITIDPPTTICDGVRCQTPGVLTFPIIADLVDEIVTVSDDAVIAAVSLLRSRGVAAEPTGALAVAAALGETVRPVVAVVSGGMVPPNVAPRLDNPRREFSWTSV